MGSGNSNSSNSKDNKGGSSSSKDIKKLQQQMQQLIDDLKAAGLKTDALEAQVTQLANKPDPAKALEDAYEAFKKKYEYVEPDPSHPCDPGFVWDAVLGKCVPIVIPPDPTGEKDALGILKVYPDAASKLFKTDFTLEKKVRNYASGKQSEPSVEYTNTAPAPIVNSEVTYYVKINGFKKEADTVSTKMRGGAHSSSNPKEGTCYDIEVATDGSNAKTLEVERPHPSMHPAHQKTEFDIGGSIVGKWIGIKAITYNLKDNKGVHIEEQLDWPVDDITKPPNKWRKYFAVDDTGQIESGMITVPFGSRSTCRIDGVWNKPVTKNPTVDDVSAPDFQYASVREIDPAAIPVVPPVDHHCAPNQTWNETLQKCVDNVPVHTCAAGEHWDDGLMRCVPNLPQPTGGKDLEGIQMLYQDDLTRAAQCFFLGRDGPNNARVDGKGARTLKGDGTVEIAPTSSTNPPTARIYIRTTNSKAFDEATQVAAMKDWAAIAARPDSDGVNRGGWSLDTFDYRDTEVTHYYRIPKINTDDEMTQYWRGGNHPHGGYPLQCISIAYKVQIQTKDCSPRSAIEWNHEAGSDGYAWNDTVKPKFDLKAALGGSMNNKLIGQKAVIWNEFDASGTKIVAAHIEIYVDTQSQDLPKPDFTKQKWDMLAEYIHTGEPGNWASAKNMNQIKGCNAQTIKIVTWGGPFIALRFDASNWIMYALSVRPILPGKKAAIV